MMKRVGWVSVLTLALLFAGAPASVAQGAMQGDAGPPGVETEVATGAMIEEIANADEASIDEYLERSAATGALIDRAAVRSYTTPAGVLVHATADVEVLEVVTEVTTGDDGDGSYEETSIAVETAEVEAAPIADDAADDAPADDDGLSTHAPGTTDDASGLDTDADVPAPPGDSGAADAGLTTDEPAADTASEPAPAADPLAGADLDVRVPEGPGSQISLVGLATNRCQFYRASYNSGSDKYKNTMHACYSRYRVDGGNGTRSLGQADDDGSNWRDFYTLRRWATITPNQDIFQDYFVRGGEVEATPTSHTTGSLNSGLIDWAPKSGACGGTATFSFAGVGLPVSVPVCSSGTDINLGNSNGYFRSKYSCTVCGGGTRAVGFHIAVEITQGHSSANWTYRNKASFRKNLSTTTASIDASQK